MAKKPSKKPPGSGPGSETDMAAGTPGVASGNRGSRPKGGTSATDKNSSETRDASQSTTGVPAARPMRLKVLYSLDDLMPNCLARAKEIASVRVAHIDENTPVGFVDLKTCVLNIVYASPEILHHHACDYSVYAYDYSEPDTPMVGLGLLSWVLSLPSLNGTQPDPDAIDPAQASRMVTGRVQKNLLGLFSGDVKETLEVRMRLCRVPSMKQSDYLNQMNQYSQLSQNMPGGVDPATFWTKGMMMQAGVGNQQTFPQGGPVGGGMAPYGASPYATGPQPGNFNMFPGGPMGYPQQTMVLGAQAPQTTQCESQTPVPATSTESQDLNSKRPSEPKVSTAAPLPEGPSPQETGDQSSKPRPSTGGTNGETPKEESAPDAGNKKRKRRPPTGRPRGRPKLADARKSNAETQPSPRDDVPQDPAAAAAAGETPPSAAAPSSGARARVGGTGTPSIKEAATPTSVAQSPNPASIPAPRSSLAPPASTASVSSSPQLSAASQSTPTLIEPSSPALSPVALVPVMSTDEPPKMEQELPSRNVHEVNMMGDVDMVAVDNGTNYTEDDDDADTEIADDSEHDSDVDSLFIGSSPPPTHLEESQHHLQQPTSPVATAATPSSPVISRPPSKGIFLPSNSSFQTSILLREALSQDNSSDEEPVAQPPGATTSIDASAVAASAYIPLQLPQQSIKPQTSTHENTSTDDLSNQQPASEKSSAPQTQPQSLPSPNSTAEPSNIPPSSPTSQQAPPKKKRGRPPKNPVAIPDAFLFETPTSPVLSRSASDKPESREATEVDDVQDPKSKPKRPPPLPVPNLPAPNLPPGLTFPTLVPTDSDTMSRKRRSSEVEAGAEQPGPNKRGSTTALVRQRIQRQMFERLAAGEMPTYCLHCGAIETPTWRKAKINVKVPNPDPNVEEHGEELREVNLCNPCGLWFHNHGSMRPTMYWDKKSPDTKEKQKKRKSKKDKARLSKQESTVSTTSTSTLARMNSTASASAAPSSPPAAQKTTGHAATSPNRPSYDGACDDEDEGHAINKELRRVQSSPGGLGSSSHPICLLSPDQKTRRKLFPEAKRTPTALDGTTLPDVAGEGSPTEGSRSPEEPIGTPEMEKENNPPLPLPTEMDWEQELERTLMRANAEVDAQAQSLAQTSRNLEDEEQGAEEEEESDQSTPEEDETVRPSTPTNQITLQNIMDFKTPIRLTPLLASVNMDSPSFWKNGLMNLATPSGKIVSAQSTPNTSKIVANGVTMSPATGEIMLEFLSEWNIALAEGANAGSPTPATGGADEVDDPMADLNFDLTEEDFAFTSEANAMPSSPPALFNLYDEDRNRRNGDEGVRGAAAISSSLFSEVLPSSPGNINVYRLDLDGGDKEQNNQTKEAAIEAMDFNFDDTLVVDFSDYRPDTKVRVAPAAPAAAMEASESIPAQVASTTSDKKEISEDESSSSESK